MKIKKCAAVLVVGLVFAGCQNPASRDSSTPNSGTSTPNSGTSVVTGLALLKAYGVDTNLTYAQTASYNPLGNKATQMKARSELFVSGAYCKVSGDHLNKTATIVDETTAGSTAFSILSHDTDASWSMNPHASVGANVDGSGIQKIVVVSFKPKSGSMAGGASNTGNIELRTISGTTSPYTRSSAITLATDATVTITVDSWAAQESTDIAAADIDGDGRDELAVIVGHTVLILDDETANFKQLQSYTFDKSSSDKSIMHATRMAAGDIDDDGLAEFVVVDSVNNTSTTNYYIYGNSDGSQEATGVVQHPSRGVPQITSVAIGDLDGDKQKEVIFAGGRNSTKNSLDIYAAKWDSTNKNLHFQDWFYNRSYNWDDHPVPALVTFKPTTVADSAKDDLLCIDTVLQYDSSVSTGSANSIGLLYTTPAQPLYECAVASDFNSDGRQEIAILDRNADLRIYGIPEGGTFSQVGYINYDGGYSDYYALAAADVRGNSVVVEYQDHNTKYTKPIVVAALASPPYYGDVVSTDSLSNYGTSFSLSSGTSSSTTGSFSVNASFSIGLSVETPLWGSAGSTEAKATFGASFTYASEKSKETTVTKSYSCVAGEDTVIFTCIPVDVYTYKVIRSSNSAAIGDILTVNVPRTPQMVSLDRAKYNALPSIPVTIDSNVLAHTFGDPTSYPSFNSVKAKIQASTKLGGGLWDSTGMYLGGTIGAITDSVEQVNSNSNSFGVGFSYTSEGQTVSGGFLYGYSYGFEGSLDLSFGSSSGWGIEGVVPNQTGSHKAFGFGIAAWQQAVTVQTSPFIVVSYWVK